jgi:hypothetical protein
MMSGSGGMGMRPGMGMGGIALSPEEMKKRMENANRIEIAELLPKVEKIDKDPKPRRS